MLTSQTNELLLLDSAIRDWVVIPMIIMMIIVGIGRTYVSILIKSEPKITENSLKTDLRYKQVVFYSQRLRTNGNYINSQAYNKRKLYLLQKKTGLLNEKVPSLSTNNPMLSNPNMLVDMMKNNMVFMIPNIAMMTFVSYFFSGFVCLKLPFALPSNRFKLMLQRDVDLSSLDVTYVSSLSWYFLTTFGLNGVYKLILGDGADINDMQAMQMQMGGMGGGQGQMFDATVAFRGEKDMLNIYKHEFIADHYEKKLLGDRYPAHSTENIDLSRLNKNILS